MNRRNLKARKVVKALTELGCKIMRNTPHGVIIENPINKKSTNIPTHRDILAIWIYNNIIKQLDISKNELEKFL